jgi:cytochrome P450
MKNPERICLPTLSQTFKANPYPVYDSFRSPECSIVAVRLPTGVEGWLVTGHAAVRQLLSDRRLSKVSPSARKRRDTSLRSEADKTAECLFDHFLAMDPPDHTRLRSVVAREFSNKRMEGLRESLREIAGRLLDAIAPRGKADLIEAFALPFPLKVICELVGVPAADEVLVQRWSALLFKADFDDPDQIPAIARDIENYLAALAQSKCNARDDSICSALVAAQELGTMADKEVTATLFLLLFAGHETSVNLFGNGIVALLSNPTEWSKLCTNGGLAAAAVDELLRFDSPLEVATPRFALSEIRIEDVRIQTGDLVFIVLGAANRDPRIFENPDRLDIGRIRPHDHVAFGHGIHRCVGAGLARLEAEVGFTELSRRFPDLELDAKHSDLIWKLGLGMRGVVSLPVRFAPQNRNRS